MSPASVSLGRTAEDTAQADVALRCAWLREHGHRLFSVDPSGRLSAQLWDFADLLEFAQREGWLR